MPPSEGPAARALAGLRPDGGPNGGADTGQDSTLAPDTHPPDEAGGGGGPPSAVRLSPEKTAEVPLVLGGRYRLTKLLGRGSMGRVYLAQDEKLGRRVALKIPFFYGDQQDPRVRRFYREARAAAALHHPNICPVHDVGEESGLHYISMGYLEGSRSRRSSSGRNGWTRPGRRRSCGPSPWRSRRPTTTGSSTAT